MKVRVKYSKTSIKGTLYFAGDELELTDEEYATYINDVDKIKGTAKVRTKPVKKVKTKSK